MKVTLVYSDAECNTYDVFNDDNVMIAYYYEHFVHPETKEKLNTKVYEIYYDYDSEYEEFTNSDIIDDVDFFNTRLLQIVESF